jgi:hypothetical protein
MALLTPQQVGITGRKATYAAASGGGDTLKPDDSVCLHVKNGSGGSITVTVVVPGEKFGQPLTDVAVAIPGGEDRFIGPFPRELADPADGLVDITYSDVTSLTVAALRV